MVIGNSLAKKICLCVFICVLRVICTRVTAGPLPGCYRQAAAVLVGWITNRACCQCNSPCLGFLTSSSRRWLSIVGIHFFIYLFFLFLWSQKPVCGSKYTWIWCDGIFSLLMAGDWSQECWSHRRFSWTHVGGRCCPASFWRSKDVVTLRLTRNLRSDCYGFPIFWVEGK